MLAARAVKLMMIASLALFAFLVTFNNVTDYGANVQFVRHVLSMDTTFLDNSLAYRAITDPVLWHLGYAVIILSEALTSLALTAAVVELARNLRGSAVRLGHAERFVFVGAGLGFLVWFFGFMVVGGEWFAMWQSATWNGQATAFGFTAMIGLVLVVLLLPETD